MRTLMMAVVLGARIASAPLGAQGVERPVPFDSAGRVMTISGALAARLRLTPPAWPVTGDYVEARLFDRGEGRFVLAVERSDRSVERYELSSEERGALQREITAAMRNSGNLTTGERQDVLSEPAKGQFVRDQTIGALFIYGPAVAALTSEGSAAASVYLLTVGAAFFTSAQLAQRRMISKAQNYLARDGIWRGAGVGSAALYVAAGDNPSGDAAAAAALGGALAGTIIGFHVGRPLADGEASGAAFGSTILGLTTAGVIGAAGGYDRGEPRGQVAAIIGGVLAGFPVGFRYVRRASYGVTAGDVSAMSAASFIGVLAAATAVVDGDPSGEAVSAVLTAGLLTGTIIGDRVLVRPYDFTDSEGRLMLLGAIAGGLVGVALPLAVEAQSAAVYTGFGALGAIAGMAVTKGLIAPAAGSRREPRGTSARAMAVTLHPENIGLLFARPRGTNIVPLVSVRY